MSLPVPRECEYTHFLELNAKGEFNWDKVLKEVVMRGAIWKKKATKLTRGILSSCILVRIREAFYYADHESILGEQGEGIVYILPNTEKMVDLAHLVFLALRGESSRAPRPTSLAYLGQDIDLLKKGQTHLWDALSVVMENVRLLAHYQREHALATHRSIRGPTVIILPRPQFFLLPNPPCEEKQEEEEEEDEEEMEASASNADA